MSNQSRLPTGNKQPDTAVSSTLNRGSGPIDWSKTTFDGSRREQLRRALTMTVRERLEALDELTRLSQCIQAMSHTFD